MQVPFAARPAHTVFAFFYAPKGSLDFREGSAFAFERYNRQIFHGIVARQCGLIVGLSVDMDFAHANSDSSDEFIPLLHHGSFRSVVFAVSGSCVCVGGHLIKPLRSSEFSWRALPPL